MKLVVVLDGQYEGEEGLYKGDFISNNGATYHLVFLEGRHGYDEYAITERCIRGI